MELATSTSDSILFHQFLIDQAYSTMVYSVELEVSRARFEPIVIVGTPFDSNGSTMHSLPGLTYAPRQRVVPLLPNNSLSVMQKVPLVRLVQASELSETKS